jgi:hypothetical protein
VRLPTDPCPESRVEEPGDPRAPVELVVGIDGEPGRHAGAEEAKDDHRRGHRRKKFVLEEEAEAGQDSGWTAVVTGFTVARRPGSAGTR